MTWPLEDGQGGAVEEGSSLAWMSVGTCEVLSA